MPKYLRARWFGVATPPQVPSWDEVEYWGMRPGKILEDPTSRFVDQDISSSQAQILAVFLGLDDLEALAGSRDPKFKEYLADRIWALHERTPGGVLAAGYGGPRDPRLINFAKEHWMRPVYGGKLTEVIRDAGKEPAEYGPGWRTTSGLWAKGGVLEAEQRALDFWTTLPPWADDVTTFLSMCSHLASAAVEPDPSRGAVFTNPFDGAEVRLNPAQRATKNLSFGPHKIAVSLPGRTINGRFSPLPVGPTGECPVDRRRLAQRVAPCLVHMLDAYLSALVIEGVHDEGIRDLIAVHDGWYVPETFFFRRNPNRQVLDGQEILAVVIKEAGKEWLEGLGPVYDRLLHYLGSDPTFGQFVRTLKDRWEARVRAGQWPEFTAVSD